MEMNRLSGASKRDHKDVSNWKQAVIKVASGTGLGLLQDLDFTRSLGLNMDPHVKTVLVT